MGNFLTQIFPPKPLWTADNMPDLTGKVTCVTGGYAGIGYETSKALLLHNAKVYMAGRSEEKGAEAVAKLKEETGNAEVSFLKVDLGDIPSVIAAARELAAKEKRLDLLFNNAGLMNTPLDAKSKQAYEVQWGTNVVGHFIFTKELLPLLLATAKTAPGETRVIWTSSNGHAMAPKGIINFDDINLSKENGWVRYGQSKAAAILLATAMTQKYSKDGLLSFSVHPGAIKTDIARTSSRLVTWMLSLVMHPPAMGAISLLYAATSPDLKTEEGGTYFIPWARVATPKKGTQDVQLAIKLWDFLEEDVKKHI